MSEERLRILLVEDDPDDVLLIRKILEKANPVAIGIEHVSELNGALQRLSKGGVDLVLLDLFLPDSGARQTLRDIRSLAPSVPIIVLTSLDDESAALEAVGHGAQDYLVKGDLNGAFLLRTIRYAIERQRIRLELNEANARLEQLAFVDPLTGILNRRGLQQILSGHVQRISRDSDLMALLIDLDDFKHVNDTLGHAVGDVVLNEVTRRIKTSLRASDCAARVGGDEFVLLLPETRVAEGVHVAEKVRLAISGNPVVLSSEKSIRVTGSLGLITVPPAASSIDELLVATHMALAKSKRAGKNQVSYDFEGQTSHGEDGNLQNVQSQLLIGPFRALRQPIYNLTDSNKVGYEFLSRSMIEHFEMPDDFFRVSLENNILTSVDHQCLKTCVAAALDSVAPDLRFHFNLFPSTLIDIPVQHLIEELQTIHGKSKSCIEISEQQIIGDPSYLVKPVEELKRSDILVAIDDVGFGRSCFESLILLEPDIIKIDKGCVTGVARDRARLRSLKRILNVARVLETEVIAEGIESKEDLKVLKELGVQYGQGYFFGKPVDFLEKTPALN